MAKLDLTEAYILEHSSISKVTTIPPISMEKQSLPVSCFAVRSLKCPPYFYQNDETNYCSSSRAEFTANNTFKRYSPDRRELLNCEGEYTNNSRPPDLSRFASQPIESI